MAADARFSDTSDEDAQPPPKSSAIDTAVNPDYSSSEEDVVTRGNQLPLATTTRHTVQKPAVTTASLQLQSEEVKYEYSDSDDDNVAGTTMNRPNNQSIQSAVHSQQQGHASCFQIQSENAISGQYDYSDEEEETVNTDQQHLAGHTQLAQQMSSLQISTGSNTRSGYRYPTMTTKGPIQESPYPKLFQAKLKRKPWNPWDPKNVQNSCGILNKGPTANRATGIREKGLSMITDGFHGGARGRGRGGGFGRDTGYNTRNHQSGQFRGRHGGY